MDKQVTYLAPEDIHKLEIGSIEGDTNDTS